MRRHIAISLTFLLTFYLIDETSAASQKALSGAQYTCRRQSYKETCATGLKSQFVWRWYLEDGECRTYPYGYCVGEDDVGADQALRYQEDCETYCVKKEKVVPRNPARSQFEEFNRRARNRYSSRLRSDRDDLAAEQPSLAGYGGFAGPSAGPSPPGHFSFEQPSNGGRGSDSGARVEVLGPEVPPQVARPEEGRGRPASGFEGRGTESRVPQGSKGKGVSYSCERLPYREKCLTGLHTQFTIRWHLYNGECISYPYGYCNGIDSIETDPSIRYKEDCETICIRGQKLNIQPGQRKFDQHHHHDQNRRRYTFMPSRAGRSWIVAALPGQKHGWRYLKKETTQLAQLCSLSIDSGTCANVQTRFAYDRQQRKCVPFMYNGCGGNLNNFLTMEDCSDVCQKTDQFDFAKRAPEQRTQDLSEVAEGEPSDSK